MNGSNTVLCICKCLTACIVALLPAGESCAGDSEVRTAVWPDGFNARVQALALLQTLNVDLLTHNSATLTLERWCDAHKLASPAIVVAELVVETRT
jgi:hypothetical protein